MRFLFILPIFFCLHQVLISQGNVIMLQNPSFEGIPAEGTMNGKLPDGWYDCGFPGESIPDVHPKPNGGAFQVTTLPADGNTYLGLIVRDNDTWEAISQRLSGPLMAGKTYSFSISLCRSLTYISASRNSPNLINFATPITLRIWGGDGYCSKKEMLAVSDPVINDKWKKYDFNLTPTTDYQYLILEAFYRTPTPFPYNGNLLMDNASNLVEVASMTEADRHEFSRPLMGTDFRIVAYHPDSVKVKEAVEKAFNRVAVLQKVFSDYDEGTEVNSLSDNGSAEVSDELWEVLDYALNISARSEGAFDVTVGSLTKLWRKAIRQKEFPPKSEFDQAKATVGYEYVKMKPKSQTVKLEKEGMRLDFGAIAKGYAVDEAMAWLKEYGIRTALVDGGGDICVGNAPPGKKGWEIEVPDKFVNGELTFKKASYANTAIATSGDTYRYLEHEGVRYSHILDPKTGLGLTNRRVVTVTAPTCTAADAWATAASVGIKKLLMVDLKQETIAISVLEGN